VVTRENVNDRLSQLGYEVTEQDAGQVDFELWKILNYVMNYCNISIIPHRLDYRIIDRVCAEFLFYKKNSGQLEGFDYDTVIKRITEGDTTIQYATGQGEDTPENRFDSFVKQLERGFDKWLTHFRCIKW
jgi:hypothetical protein